jgi:hypothetical protein
MAFDRDPVEAVADPVRESPGSLRHGLLLVVQEPAQEVERPLIGGGAGVLRY